MDWELQTGRQCRQMGQSGQFGPIQKVRERHRRRLHRADPGGSLSFASSEGR
jgi:hypothetical protein